MKRLLPVLVIVTAAYLYQAWDRPVDLPISRTTPDPAASAPRSDTASPGISLIDGHQARGSGSVVRILPDDNDGSRHQRFILRLASGRTLLIAHNIDLAPRIPGIRTGDTVEFHGEFRSNPEGGVIHWTHHDPQGRHPDGWLRHRGETYR